MRYAPDVSGPSGRRRTFGTAKNMHNFTNMARLSIDTETAILKETAANPTPLDDIQ